MSVIIEFSVPSNNFQLGRILSVESGTLIELETLVPLGKSPVPLFCVHDASNDTFLKSLTEHNSVSAATPIDTFDDRTLVKLDWDASTDILFNGIGTKDGVIYSAIGRETNWKFKVLFPTHEQLSSFSAYCNERGITLTVERVYQPSDSESVPGDQLTDSQKEALKNAVEQGYYSIPRECSTNTLAAELGISDQAVTERLRRAIVALAISSLDSIDTDR